MSTTLLSPFYDIDFLCKVCRQPERMADGLEPFGVPRLAAGPGRGGRDPSKLTLRVEGSPGVSRTVGVERASSGWSSRAPPEPTAATLPGLPGQRLRRPPRGHGPRITWLDPERPGWASSTLSGLRFASVAVEAESDPTRNPNKWAVGTRAFTLQLAPPLFPIRLSSRSRSPPFGRRRNPWQTSI